MNLVVPGCGERLQSGASDSGVQSHLGGDFCVVGPRLCYTPGRGKIVPRK